MKFHKPLEILSVALFLILLSASKSSSLKTSLDYIPPLEQFPALCLDQKTQHKRSTINNEFKQINENNTLFYVITQNGRGAYGNLDNVFWERKAQLKDDNHLLKPVLSYTIIRDKGGKIISQIEKHYDYVAGLIKFRKYGENNALIKEKSFEIKGYTCDEITFAYCLGSYVANRDNPPYNHFYLLTDEPKDYKTKIRVVGEEALFISSNKTSAIKLKLTGDMGIIDDILDRFIPHTYVWYNKDQPFEWLKYQGFEAGYKSAYVIMQRTEQ